jgi:hypothetical protein
LLFPCLTAVDVLECEDNLRRVLISKAKDEMIFLADQYQPPATSAVFSEDQ